MTVEEVRKMYTEKRAEGIEKDGAGYVKNPTKDEAAKKLCDYVSTFPFDWKYGVHGDDGVVNLCDAVNCNFAAIVCNTPMDKPDFSGMTLNEVRSVIRAFVHGELDALMDTNDNREEYERLIAIYWAIRAYQKFFNSTLSPDDMNMFRRNIDRRDIPNNLAQIEGSGVKPLFRPIPD